MSDLAEGIPDPYPKQTDLLSLISTTSLWSKEVTLVNSFVFERVVSIINLTKSVIPVRQVYTSEPVTLSLPRELQSRE